MSVILNIAPIIIKETVIHELLHDHIAVAFSHNTHRYNITAQWSMRYCDCVPWSGYTTGRKTSSIVFTTHCALNFFDPKMDPVYNTDWSDWIFSIVSTILISVIQVLTSFVYWIEWSRIPCTILLREFKTFEAVEW